MVGIHDITQGLTDYLRIGKDVATKLEKYFHADYSDVNVFGSFADIDSILTSHTLNGWVGRVVFAKILRHKYGDIGFTASVTNAIAEGVAFSSQNMLTWGKANPSICQQDFNQLHPISIDDILSSIRSHLYTTYPELLIATLSALLQGALDPWSSSFSSFVLCLALKLQIFMVP